MYINVYIYVNLASIYKDWDNKKLKGPKSSISLILTLYL